MNILFKQTNRRKIAELFLCTVILFSLNVAYAQSPDIEWQKCVGGSAFDEASSVHQTADGGYILAGETDSNDGDVSGHHGNRDIWVVKLNATGDIEWQKCLGGSGNDDASSVQQTVDGGYITAGTTMSDDGDVSGHHGNRDIWIVKLNATGDIEWQKCLGGSGNDDASSVQQTVDGGYVIAGTTMSDDGDVSGRHGNRDIWVVKLNVTGDIEWQKCLGGSRNDDASSVHQTADGGYILAGETDSNDGDVSGRHGNLDFDIWVVKLNTIGEIEWQKCFGGKEFDYVSSIRQATDGGYIMLGFTRSSDGDVSGHHGSLDIWVVKLDALGEIEWQKCLGGSGAEWGSSVQQTVEGGYIVLGFTRSSDGDVSGHHGSRDIWAVRLNALGDIEWQKCLGGSGEDYGSSVQQTVDGGYIVLGFTNSGNGDVSYNHGSYDIWVIKLAYDNSVFSKEKAVLRDVFVYPNPASRYITIDLTALVSVPAGTVATFYDRQGRKVLKKEISEVAGTVDITGLPGGVYSLKVICNEWYAVHKIVIE